MHFLLFTKIGEASLQASLGLPEYSYYFVYKGFKTIFESLGEVTPVHSEMEIRRCSEQIESQGDVCIVVFFCPPHVAPDIFPLKAFCVLAWEFDTIPNERWDDDPRNDWCHVFSRHLGLICLSSNTRTVIEKAMGNGFPVKDIPVPVWDGVESVSLLDPSDVSTRCQTVELAGMVIDSRAYCIGPTEFKFKKEGNAFRLPGWDGAEIQLVFNGKSLDSGLLVGFYPAEGWGAWSRLAEPWIFLECYVEGSFTIEMRLRGFGASVGKTLTISIGGVARQFVLDSGPSNYFFRFDHVAPCNIIKFSGLDLTPRGHVQDVRTMAVGIERISMADADEKARVSSPVCLKTTKLDLDGVIYTTVFNPVDGRKNWPEIVSAFCYAFRENYNATLILKATHHSFKSIMGKLHFLLHQVGEIKCRVVALHGFLSDEDYRKLILTTSFYVNASSGEGLCLPLLEFMACGIPAIAPAHTAMADYVDDQSSFLLRYSRMLDVWPHDPRSRKRAISFRVDWGSLVDQYRKSYACVMYDRAAYRRKSEKSQENVRRLTNGAHVRSSLQAFINEILVRLNHDRSNVHHRQQDVLNPPIPSIASTERRGCLHDPIHPLRDWPRT